MQNYYSRQATLPHFPDMRVRGVVELDRWH